MKFPTALIPALLGVSAALSGCLSTATIQPMRYYTVTASPAVTTVPSSGKSLGIRPLIGAKPYKLAIAFTAEDHRLDYFRNAEWADLPAAIVSRALSDGLVKLGAFTEVDDAANIARPALILTGELRRFEADFNRETPSVAVELSCVLRDVESATSLWQGYVLAEAPFQAGALRDSDETLAAIAEAMSEAVAAVVEQACAQVGGALRDNAQSPA